nr:hypothetical protein [uncultured Anaerosporobacter sp.]
MDDIISSIQVSTNIQEEEADSLEQVRVNSEQFIEDTYRIDGNVERKNVAEEDSK